MRIQIALSLVLGCTLLSSGWSAEQLSSTRAQPDHPPIPVNCPSPIYPVDLRKHSLISEVVVTFVVDQTGKVAKLRVTDALVGRFNARGTVPHYVYNGNYALGQFIIVPRDDVKAASPKRAHLMPEAPVVEVGGLQGAPLYLATSQSDFGEQARKTIATWTYAPGQKDGHPVDTSLRVLVMFWRDATVTTATLD